MKMVIILLIILAGGLHMTSGDTNDKWQPNDNLIRVMNDFYFALVSPTQMFSQRQRYLAVVSLALSYYVSDCENVPNAKRVHDAVKNTRAQLDKSTEALGSIIQDLLLLLRSIIDKVWPHPNCDVPINDVKLSCPPNVCQTACEESLQKIQTRNERYCRGYMRNVRHYNEVVDLFNDKQTAELAVEISTPTKISDEDALQYFSCAANGKYAKLMKRMRDQYQKQIHTSYPCNALNVPPF